MNFHNSTQTYLRPVAKVGLRQQLRPRDLFDLPGGLVLWRSVGKVMLFILPLVLLVNMIFGSFIGSVDRSITVVDNQHHELMDQNIEMLATKARLWDPAYMQKLAGEKLSLHAVSKKQIGKFDRRKGTFTYL